MHRRLGQSKYSCIKEIKVPGEEFGAWLGVVDPFGHFQCRTQQLNNFGPRAEFSKKEPDERSHIYVFIARSRIPRCRLALNELASFFITPWIYFKLNTRGMWYL